MTDTFTGVSEAHAGKSVHASVTPPAWDTSFLRESPPSLCAFLALPPRVCLLRPLLLPSGTAAAHAGLKEIGSYWKLCNSDPLCSDVLV